MNFASRKLTFRVENVWLAMGSSDHTHPTSTRVEPVQPGDRGEGTRYDKVEQKRKKGEEERVGRFSYGWGHAELCL